MQTGIRAARVDDVGELAALTTELGYPATAADIERRLPSLLASREDLVLVATDDADRPVAWVHAVVRRFLQADAFVQIAGLVVADGERGSGIGSRLLAAAEQWAVEIGIPVVRVRSNVVRDRTHGFYLRAGYTLTKTSHLFVKQLR